MRARDRDTATFGAGKWTRVLIDATINLDYDPEPQYGGNRYPPTVMPSKEDWDLVERRWKEYGID